MPPEIEAGIQDVATDHRSGAVELARRTAAVLMRTPPDLLEEAASRLVRAHPAMAPIFNLANLVLLAASSGCDPAAAARDFLGRLEESVPRIAGHAAGLIGERATVLTHSASETVAAALLAARDAGKDPRVIATESRPACEGRLLADRLGQAGIPVRLIIDAAMLRFLDQADLVMVGADAVYPGGVVNKIGTALLALAARERMKRFYVLCSAVKLAGAGWRGQMTENFETCPLEHVSGIVTEEGVLAPEKLRGELERAETHASCKLFAHN